jgi:hypothetical protein
MPNCVHGIDSRFCARCANPDVTAADRKATIRRRAAVHVATSAAEREAYEAVYAYEEAASTLKSRRVRASRTWQVIERKGVIAAVDAIVTRKDETPAYRILVEMGLQDMTFEAVVLRHKEAFSADAIVASERRLKDTRDGTGPRRLPTLPRP